MGQTIDQGRFRLVCELGQGSFATVYKAEITNRFSTPTTFAVKALYKPGLTPNQLQSQRNEVQFLKTLSEHPNICKLIKIVETDINVFLIMELCDTDLFDLIVPPNTTKSNRTGLPETTVQKIFAQLASAISFSHSHGIYHRDLKPENVLIVKEPSLAVKLADFGLATSSQTSREFGCGSVRYMSPECLDSKLSSAQGYACDSNDVWSLAIILINLLTGKNPWIEPRKTDPNYSLYLSEKQAVETLKNQFKLSSELAYLLSRVFSPNVSRRLTLAEFASSVAQLAHLRAPAVPLPSPAISIPPLSNSPPRISLGWNDLQTPSASPPNVTNMNIKTMDHQKLPPLTTLLFHESQEF